MKIYAIGAHVRTFQLTSTTEWDAPIELDNTKYLSKDDILKSFNNLIYFKTEEDAIQHAKNNAEFKIREKLEGRWHEKKVMTGCSCVFELEVADYDKNSYRVVSVLSGQVPNYPKFLINEEINYFEKKVFGRHVCLNLAIHNPFQNLFVLEQIL